MVWTLGNAWKVSVVEVILARIPVFGLNTDRYSVSLRIQSECKKKRTLYAVQLLYTCKHLYRETHVILRFGMSSLINSNQAGLLLIHVSRKVFSFKTNWPNIAFNELIYTINAYMLFIFRLSDVFIRIRNKESNKERKNWNRTQSISKTIINSQKILVQCSFASKFCKVDSSDVSISEWFHYCSMKYFGSILFQRQFAKYSFWQINLC